MGFLGLSLIFVGIALVVNGVSVFTNAETRSVAVVNAMTGLILVVGNFIMLSRAQATADFLNVTSGFLFGFTYILIALNRFLRLDAQAFGWYNGFVAVYAIVMSCVCFATGAYILGALWAVWSILWLEGFLEIVCKLKIGRVFPYLSIFEGVFAAFIPAILMLLEVI